MSKLRVFSYVMVFLAIVGVSQDALSFNTLLAIFLFYAGARLAEYLTIFSFMMSEKMEQKLSKLIKSKIRL